MYHGLYKNIKQQQINI